AVNGKAVPPQQPPADRRSHAAILEVIDRLGLLDRRYLTNTPQLIPSRGWRLRAGHWRALYPSGPGSQTVHSGTSTARAGRSVGRICRIPKLIVRVRFPSPAPM